MQLKHSRMNNDHSIKWL